MKKDNSKLKFKPYGFLNMLNMETNLIVKQLLE
jgi:hypothetical protein